MAHEKTLLQMQMIPALAVTLNMNQTLNKKLTKLINCMLYLRNIADSQIFGRTLKFSNLGVLLTPKKSGSKSTPVTHARHYQPVQGMKLIVTSRDVKHARAFSLNDQSGWCLSA